ncbi:MAG TPA: proton-conducting transporter membrane subunit, partial [Chryseosolibacter sp.]
IVWEIMSVSSFLLVMFDYTRFATLKAGMNYLVQAHIGVTFLSLGFIWVWIAEGAFDFVAIGSFMEKGNALWLFILFFIGFGIKAGFIPLHTWLPHAHPAAPAHVSGIMSGVMVAMGIYGLLRVTTYLTTNLSLIGGSVLVISAATAFYGVISAAIHRDYKRILAFSTIENIGIIGMGIGIGLIGKQMGEHTLLFLGFGAALLHALNHSLYKPLMFYSSGNLYHLTNTRNIEQLGGLIRKIPFTGFFFLCGSLAIAGLPPFNGFVSKFLLFSGFLAGMNIESFQLNIFMIAGVLTLALVGGISTLAFTKSFSVIFLGTPRRPLKYQPPERFNTGHLPLFILLFLMLLIGLSPGVTLTTLGHIVYLWDNSLPQNAIALTLSAPLSGIGLASLFVILLTGFVYTIRTLAVSNRVIQTTPTWACGYAARNRRMQYTGKAFSKSLAKLFAFITNEEKKYTEIPPTTIFPPNRSYESSYAEYFEKHFINKACHQLLNLMNRFSFIHNGRVQYYILYGFIFMLILIVATFSNIL